MFTCKKCNSRNIKTRTNYPHGKKSKSLTSAICKDCGSADMQVMESKGRRGSRRR